MQVIIQSNFLKMCPIRKNFIDFHQGANKVLFGKIILPNYY